MKWSVECHPGIAGGFAALPVPHQNALGLALKRLQRSGAATLSFGPPAYATGLPLTHVARTLHGLWMLPDIAGGEPPALFCALRRNYPDLRLAVLDLAPLPPGDAVAYREAAGLHNLRWEEIETRAVAAIPIDDLLALLPASQQEDIGRAATAAERDERMRGATAKAVSAMQAELGDLCNLNALQVGRALRRFDWMLQAVRSRLAATGGGIHLSVKYEGEEMHLDRLSDLEDPRP